MAKVSYEKYKLKTYHYWTVYLHGKQNYLGRCYVALNRPGNLDPFADTSLDEKAELETILQEVKTAIDELYQPALYNYANFRNTWPWCHWHLIPRYETSRTIDGQTFMDENWGKNYAPYDRNFKVPEEIFWKIHTAISKNLASNYWYNEDKEQK